MTDGKTNAGPGNFAAGAVPWLIAGAGLLVYMATLNHWVSLLSLQTVTRVSGWSWRTEVGQPLRCVLLYPFGWLPAAWMPLALNVFTAICGALVLALLARSVALLRYDVVDTQPSGKGRPARLLSIPKAWLPPVLAGLVCGLQLSFWEHATSASGEMLDLLVFAYIVRCLLEFRVNREQRWLSQSACLYGAGMANHWLMVGYFPVFLLAVLLLKGLGRFLKIRFLLRMALWGLAGMSLYLLLPIILSVSSHGELGLWMVLKAHLHSQKEALGAWQQPAFRILITTSLLPFIVPSIRWKSHTVQVSDDSRLGVFLTRATGHVVHGVVLIVALWLALEPAFSPRNQALGTPFLSYYYGSALVFGYCVGYFLLLGSKGKRERVARFPAAAARVLVFVLPLMLLSRNFGEIHRTNGPALHRFARQLYADLPAGRSVALSDDPRRLLLLRAELSAHHREKDALLLDTSALPSAQYLSFMASRFSRRWPITAPTNRFELIGPNRLMELVRAFAAREPVVYLHPSYGLVFEAFLDQPNGLVHRLVMRPSDADQHSESLDGAASNESLWQQRWTDGLKAQATRSEPETKKEPGPVRSLLELLRLTPERNATAAFLGAAYSKSLDDWGVRMQCLGRWPEAAEWFRRAAALNSGNLAARLNLEYNRRRQRGENTRLNPARAGEQFAEAFATHETWLEVLNAGGPVDEPTFLFRTARMLLAGGFGQQAADAFARCAELAPDWAAPKLWLAEGRLAGGDPGGALKLTERVQESGPPQNGQGWAQLLRCRVNALRELGRTNEAGATIEGFVKDRREHGEVLSAAAELYAQAGQFGPELALLEELLRREPNEARLLARKGFAELRLSNYSDAIAVLSTALALTPADSDARLWRAIACLNAGQLHAARGDYLELLRTTNQVQNALFGLGAVAWRQQDTNAAIGFYRQFLSNTVPETTQATIASERLKQLSGARSN